MPLLGFLFETPVCLVEEFRDGNVSPGAGHLAFYRACQARLPAGKRLAAYRADSASYQAALINALEADQVRWAITADQDVAVKAVIAGGPTEGWAGPGEGGVEGAGGGVWLSGGGGRAHHERDEGGVSPEHQARRAAAGRVV